MEKKQKIWQKPGTKKFIAAVVVFGFIFAGNLLIAKSGGMAYISKAAMKLQHLMDGQKKTFADSSNVEEELVPAGEVTKNRALRQFLEIRSDMLGYDSLCIAVKIGTFRRKNTGEFVLEFRQGSYVEQKTIDVSGLEDNTYVRIYLDVSKLSAGEAVLSCSSDSEEGSGITVICTDQCVYRDFFINEDRIEKKNMKMNLYVPFG